jgi:hypothetical protein
MVNLQGRLEALQVFDFLEGNFSFQKVLGRGGTEMNQLIPL